MKMIFFGGGKENNNFEDIIAYGFHVYEGRIDIVGKEEAIVLYREYQEVCGFPEENYSSTYYEKRKVYAADIEYVRRCAMRQDIGVDEFIEKYKEEGKNVLNNC